ncbi:type IV-A pilus assembly ATPase PilB [Luminiphilus sp.]|nr:type IV-A pilus assembly ATPase PilB [Luminiphilus sp.]MDA7840202.1 type IV-A pilus assembly ATPase PilB [Luminiphilus sp.]
MTGITARLVADGVISTEQAQTAIRESSKKKIPLINYLSQTLDIDSYELAELAAAEFGVPLLDLSAVDSNMFPDKLVSPALMTKHQTIPIFRRGNRLFIALADPTNIAALDEIKFATGISTEAVVVDQRALSKLLTEILDQQDSLSSEMDQLGESSEFDLDIIDENSSETEDVDTSAVDDTPIVRFVNKVLLDAIKQGASDIHFEPYEQNYRVRFRTDGILREIVKPPKTLAPRLAARIKVMSQMDISERRIPQDGRIQMKLSKNRSIDFRVNTLPTMFGEKIVMRILDPTSAQMGIDALGYDDDQKQLFLDALAKPQGMILVTGPTGSGKTVSLYTGLSILNTDERNISTAEDPVEINMEGVNQVLVNNKVGLDFAEALRSFLRQDPDIIMVGEIRDIETAEIAIKAAQTGHLVLSTLHTNSAAETITRMMNMGVPAYNIASSVSLIIAQRLARRLCKQCSIPETEVPHDALMELGFNDDMLENATIKRAVGCEACKDGYRGRVGIYEVVKVTKTLANLIMGGDNSIDLDKQARREGFADLRLSALRKAAQGLISLEEVNRVTTD